MIFRKFSNKDFPIYIIYGIVELRMKNEVIHQKRCETLEAKKKEIAKIQ